MALGAALATGRPQAYAVVRARACSTTVCGAGDCLWCCAPVLALVGQIPAARSIAAPATWHEVHDQLGLLRPPRQVRRPDRCAAPGAGLVSAALRQALAAPQRPVALGMRARRLGRRRRGRAAGTPVARRAAAGRRGRGGATRRGSGAAARPIIVVRRPLAASDEVTAIAELLQAPVIAYRRGRGVVDSRTRCR